MIVAANDKHARNASGQYQQYPDDPNGLRIIRAYYGVQGRTVNVTDLLRNNVRDRSLYLQVNNNALGGDPAVGATKVLIVIYRYQGTESATAVLEGNTLSLP